MVDPAYRGEGYGLALTKARLTYVGARNAGIDGVPDMLDKYERLGYKIAHYNARYEMQSVAALNVQPELPVVALSKIPYFEDKHLIVPYSLVTNDFRYQTTPGFSAPEEFFSNLKIPLIIYTKKIEGR